MGNDIHTPSTPRFKPQGLENHSRKGIINITWRARLAINALPGAPVLWKKVVAIIWKPTTPNAQRAVRNQCTVVLMSTSSEVNIIATY